MEPDSTSENSAERTDKQAIARKLDRADIILFSVQDLFGYLRAHATMSGIQRVQAGIALYAIEHEDHRVGFLLNDLTDHYRDGEFLLIDNEAFRAVIAYASGERVDHDHLRGMLGRCEAQAHVIRPRPHNTIILLGAFWGHGNTMDRYVAAKRDGVKLGAYVYDIIPVTHPEYCDAELVRDFSMSVGEMGFVIDFVFTISDYTRETLAALFRENGGRDIPMRTVPLAHSLTVPDISQESWPVSLRKIRGRPYVAYVSTVEGRKNHLYVVNAWRQMIDQGVDVPDLVFVGRRGWRISGLMDLLDGTNYLDGRVHIVHDLSDAELNSVYANCRFTVFTSFVEGWGLPVGESLIHSVPCAASGTSSLPEVGGEFVDYLDPLNLRQGVEVLRKLIEDHDYRAARRQHIAEHFVPRSWDDVGRDFIEKVGEATAVDYPPRTLHPPLAEGAKFVPGDLVSRTISMRDYVPSPMRIALAGCFYHLEKFGIWMRGNVGDITIQTDLPAGEEVIVYVEIELRDNAIGRDLAVIVAGDGADRTNRAQGQTMTGDSQRLHRARGRVGAGGLCTIVFEISGTLQPSENDTRLFAIGLVAIGYVRAANAALREDLAERFTFHDMSRAGRH